MALRNLCDSDCSVFSLSKKVKYLFEYSEKNFLIANVEKTKYLHLDSNPVSTPIEISDNNFIELAHVHTKVNTLVF